MTLPSKRSRGQKHSDSITKSPRWDEWIRKRYGHPAEPNYHMQQTEEEARQQGRVVAFIYFGRCSKA